MLLFGLRRGANLGAASRFGLGESNSSLKSLLKIRFGGTSSSDAESVATQIINYAFSHARSQKTDESYREALLVLEQGASNLCQGENSNDNLLGLVTLAMSTLLYERGDIADALERLGKISDLKSCSLAVRVATLEAMTGLHLQMEEDSISSELADKCLQLFDTKSQVDGNINDVYHSRAKAIKALVELASGNIDSARSFLDDSNERDNYQLPGNVALSHGQVFHAMRSFPLAKELYQKALNQSEAIDLSHYCLASANMISEEILLGATCALGQLATHSGNFIDAEEILTKALTKAEEHFGPSHPKVGIVLTCMAIMFGQKSKLEHSSSLLIQEGLYRRAIDLLKAPSLETEGVVLSQRRDIMALARGGYGNILCIQQNRKGEGERMKMWAENVWKNRRLSLAEVLEISETSKIGVVDTRIGRVL